MKEYIVSWNVLNKSQIEGVQPYDLRCSDDEETVAAENADQAIEFVMDNIYEQLSQNSDFNNCDAEKNSSGISVIDNDEITVLQYCNFKAAISGL